MEDFSHAHKVSLLYKLLTSSRSSADLSIGFDRDRGRRKDELARNKNIKIKNHLRIVLKDIFGFVEHQEKATYGLRYRLTLTGKDDAVIDKAVGIADARIKIDLIHWYVRHYTPSIQQQSILSKQNLKTTPTELTDSERSVLMKEVNF